MHQVVEPDPVLDEKWPVIPILVVEQRDGYRGGPRTEDGARRAAGQEMQQDEDHHRDADDDQQAVPKPADEIASHRPGLCGVLSWSRWIPRFAASVVQRVKYQFSGVMFSPADGCGNTPRRLDLTAEVWIAARGINS